MSRRQKGNNNERDTGPRDWLQEVYRKAGNIARKTEDQADEKKILSSP